MDELFLEIFHAHVCVRNEPQLDQQLHGPSSLVNAFVLISVDPVRYDSTQDIFRLDSGVSLRHLRDEFDHCSRLLNSMSFPKLLCSTLVDNQLRLQFVQHLLFFIHKSLFPLHPPGLLLHSFLLNLLQ